MMKMLNLQFFGGRGASSGGGGFVVISKEETPNGTYYWVTGNRNVKSHWDENDNYLEKEITIKEKVRDSFSTKKEAEKFAKSIGVKYTIV